MILQNYMIQSLPRRISFQALQLTCSEQCEKFVLLCYTCLCLLTTTSVTGKKKANRLVILFVHNIAGSVAI